MRKLVISASCIVAMLLLASCGSQQSSFRFYKEPPESVRVIKDIEFQKTGDTSLKMDILRPEADPGSPMPVVVWIHGGGWESGSKDATKELYSFAASGYLIASIEYRFSQEALFPAQIEDCKCAVRFLRAHAAEYNIDPDRIGVWGGSAGGHLAAMMGASNGVPELEGDGGYSEYSSDVQAACDFFGAVDFRSEILPADSSISRLIGGPPQQNIKQAAEASPIVYLSEKSAPTLIMFGDKDDAYKVLKITGEAYCKKLNDFGIYSKMVVVPGEGHGFKSFNPNYEVKKFFDRELAIGPAN